MDPEFIRDLFAPFRPVTLRRMFGGTGIYCDGLMFGLVFDGAIYLKVDEASIPDFEGEGCGPFVYSRRTAGHTSQHTLPYWRLPDRLYDDPDELAIWAKRALAIQERKQFASRARGKRTSRSAKR